MSAARFILFGSSIFKTPKPYSQPTFFAKPFRPKTLEFLRHSSSAAVVSATETLDSRHPWPEWITFVDQLKKKGYFKEGSCDEDFDEVYKDMNVLKEPTLSFARDRFDIFKSLSRKDIQAIVEVGCPNLLRKAVNSGKRLRAYVGLDEGDVCSACNLRGSCDKAYVLQKESEGARTVDIVRLIVFYALDPLVISGQEKPPGRELIEVSARRLLKMLIELSETAPDPEVIKSVEKAPRKKESLGGSEDELSRNVEMKRGDWMCTKCNFLNFSRNTKCLKCREEGPRGGVNLEDVEMKKGDWKCTECDFVNFSRNLRCLKCQARAPKRASTDEVEMKKGDWVCQQCSFMNFASNTKCLRCRDARPKRELNPGEWECPKCDFLNYRRNMMCLKCNLDRPKETVALHDEWRKPR